VRAAFDALALGLAALAAPLLEILAFPVLRSGAELRNVDAGWAVVVTEVCDGHGLIAAWLALTAALARNGRAALRMAVSGIVAIQVFNYLRVVVLAISLALVPAGFEAVHLFVFPLLTVALFAALAMLTSGVSRSTVGVALIAGFVLAVIWYFAAAAVSGAVLVPIANLLLDLTQPHAIDAILQDHSGWVVATQRLAAIDPPALLRAPIHPEDFAIALPALLAAAIATRAGWGWLALALGLMMIALTLGAVTAGWGPSLLAPASQIVQVADDGRIAIDPFAPPGGTAQSLIRLAQNGLVHFNLLVLPVLLVARPSAR